MMGDMRSPEQPHLVIYPVQPVIHEIFKNKEHYPVNPGIGNAVGKAVIIKEREDNTYINGAESQVETAIEQHEVYILKRVFPGIGIF
jgi:hypothetical protein